MTDAAALELPDVLVLGAGGIVGEAWMTGVLGGIEAAAGIDFRETESILGTSAGSIVGAHLAAGRRPRRPPPPIDADHRLGGSPRHSPLVAVAAGALRETGRVGALAAMPAVPVALSAGAPGGALVRAALLARMPRPGADLAGLRRRIDRLRVRFDGRLRVACVDRASGRRVVFGAPGVPHASVGAAVEASCAIPWRFAGVTIAGREYVDGGLWSPTNLDAAPAGHGSHVLCLAPTAGLALLRSAPRPSRVFARSALTLEEIELRRRGARVRTVTPDTRTAAALGSSLMDPERAGDALVAGFVQGRELR